MKACSGRARTGALLAALLPFAWAAGEAGAEDPAALGSAAWRHLRETPRLLGDPGGARTRLDELGVTLQLFFQTFTGLQARGGVQSAGALRNSGSYDLFAIADLEELGLLPGNNVLIQTKGNYGRNVNPRVGALSDPIDDADFDEAIWVAQLWTEQQLVGGRVRLRAGYLDQGVLLDRNAYANSEDRQFISSFLDNNPLVPLRIGIGATLLASPTEWLELLVGTADADNRPRQAGFDTAFDGAKSLMGYFEATARVRPSGPRGTLPGTYRLGVFHDASRKRAFNRGESSPERGHQGFYLSFDQLAFRESPEDQQGLGLFARYGYADPDVNKIEHFWSTGVQYEGLLPNRDRDVLGLGVYQAIGSDRFRRKVARDFRRETGLEFYYSLALTPWLVITPDAQLIVDPGGLRSARDAVVLVLRIRVTL
jgi:porin